MNKTFCTKSVAKNKKVWEIYNMITNISPDLIPMKIGRNEVIAGYNPVINTKIGEIVQGWRFSIRGQNTLIEPIVVYGSSVFRYGESYHIANNEKVPELRAEGIEVFKDLLKNESALEKLEYINELFAE